MKKGLIIVFFLLFALVIIGSVNAESDGTKETIRGIDFNIPQGYSESDLSDRNNVSTDVKATTDIVIYSGEDNVFSIMVIEYDEGVFDELLDGWGKNGSINNIQGRVDTLDDGNYTFTYLKDKCFVQVVAPTKELVEDIVIE